MLMTVISQLAPLVLRGRVIIEMVLPTAPLLPRVVLTTRKGLAVANLRRMTSTSAILHFLMKVPGVDVAARRISLLVLGSGIPGASVALEFQLKLMIQPIQKSMIGLACFGLLRAFVDIRVTAIAVGLARV